MALHLIKLRVGAASVDDQRVWIKKRMAQNHAAGLGRVYDCVTRMRPRRVEELLDGGSLYWVIKGAVQGRQRILELSPREGRDGVERTAIILDPQLHLTIPQPRRAFQGWRYLSPDDAPADLAVQKGGGAPPELTLKLADLGLL